MNTTARSAGALWLLQQALQPLFELACEALHAYRRSRHRAACRRELESLGDAMLRDIGLDRAEIDSVLAEAEGRVEATRLVRWQAPDRGAWP